MNFKQILIFIFQRQASPFTDQLINKISDWYPIRRAAQLTAYVYLKSKDKGLDVISDYSKKAIKNINDEIKKIKDKKY